MSPNLRFQDKTTNEYDIVIKDIKSYIWRQKLIGIGISAPKKFYYTMKLLTCIEFPVDIPQIALVMSDILRANFTNGETIPTKSNRCGRTNALAGAEPLITSYCMYAYVSSTISRN